MNSLLGGLIVLGLVGFLAWLARRGTFAGLQSRNRSMSVETAIGLGERRSLVVVSVEGRRLLLGVTPGQVSFLTELGPVPPGGDIGQVR